MKFKADPKVLSQALRLVGGVVESRPAHPELVNVLFTAEDGKGQITGTNTEVEAHVEVPLPGIEVGDQATITLPAKKLIDALALMKKDEVSLEYSGEKVLLKSGRNVYRFATVDPETIPLFGEEKKPLLSFTLPSKKMLDMLRHTAFSMANQDTRFFLNGALFEVTPYHFRVVASDGHRLAMCTHTEVLAEDLPDKTHAIIPRKAITELMRFLEGDEEADDRSVQVAIGEHQVSIEVGGKTIKSKLIDGQFPEYERVLPKNIAHEIEGSRAEIYDACRQAAVLFNEEHGGVIIRLTKEKQLSFQSNNALDESAEIFFEAEYKGDELEVAFKATYLHEILGALSGEKVQIKLQDSGSSGTIQCPTRDDILYVVMPLRL